MKMNKNIKNILVVAVLTISLIGFLIPSIFVQ